MTPPPHPDDAPRPVRALADEYFACLCALNPIMATALGAPGHDHEMFLYTPDAHDARFDLDRRTRARLDQLRAQHGPAPLDDAERLTWGTLSDHLDTSIEAHLAHDHLANLSSIVGDVIELRETLETMSADPQLADALTSRRQHVPVALAGMEQTWRLGLASGHIAPRRQTLEVLTQLDAWLQAENDPAPGPSFAISNALVELRDFLRHEYLPRTPERDAVGAEAYARHARVHLGAHLDIDDAYARGFDELARIESEIRAHADQMITGATPALVRARLDADPRYVIESDDAMCDWANGIMQAAIDTLEKPDASLFPSPCARLTPS